MSNGMSDQMENITKILRRFNLSLKGKVDAMELDSDDGSIGFYDIQGFGELESVLLGIEAGFDLGLAEEQSIGG